MNNFETKYGSYSPSLEVKAELDKLDVQMVEAAKRRDVTEVRRLKQMKDEIKRNRST